MENKLKSLKQLLITNTDIIQNENKGKFLFSLNDLPYLSDHAFQGMIVLPGSAYIEMALVIFNNLFSKIPGMIQKIDFENIILLSEKETSVEFEIVRTSDGTVIIKFAEKNETAVSVNSKSSSTSMFLTGESISVDSDANKSEINNFIARASVNIHSDEFYKRLSENGNQYGPKFQNIKEIWISGNEAVGKLISSSSEFSISGEHFLHPSLLDSFTQLLSSLSDSKGRTFVLNYIDEIKIYNLNLPEEIWCKAKLLSQGDENGFNGDLRIIDSSGNIYLELKRVNFKYLEQQNNNLELIERKQQICIASTFTADPLEDSLKFWSNHFKFPYQIVFAPYNQVFQELLDSNSLFHKNKDGINVILLGLEDWAKENNLLTPKVDAVIMDELFKGRAKYILPNQVSIVHLNKYETDYVYKEIFEDQVYLKHGITIDDGDTVIDIGANIGLFTLFVNQCGKNMQVYSFEPSPIVYELLKTNTAVYGEKNKTYNLGVSDKKKTARFTFYKSSSVFSSFNANETEDKEAIQAVVRNMLDEVSSYDTGDLNEYVEEITSGRLESQTFDCQLISVSDIIKENGIEKIDLLKIDAEKSELDIIKGIDDSDWAKIKQIVIEVHDKTGNIFKEIKSILVERDFNFEVEEEKFLKESGLYNIYAIRTGKGNNINSVNSALENKRKKLDENLRNFIQVFSSFIERSGVPMIAAVCDRSPDVLSDVELSNVFDEMEKKLSLQISDIPNVYFLESHSIAEKYPVKEYFDAHGNELGHIPYTNEYFVSLGTLLFRNIFSLKNAGYKVIALDCDNTLWKGVCGEDGVSGIRITEGYKELQKFILAQIKAGMVVCLCSKNNEEDVFDVFDKRDDMILKREHLVSWKINWNMKSENLKVLANELNLGLDSFIFLDDNPVECGEVKINCPDVLTLQLPEDDSRIKDFIYNIWAFDHIKLTKEDTKRTQMYKENIQREKYRESTLSLKDFLDGLQLNIKISNPTPEQISRVSQLTFRTNQFNFTTIRRTESEVNDLLDQSQNHCLIASVSDRFGDYGLVGVLFYSIVKKNLIVDTFLLSCRVLGRGVEYKILASLGKIAKKENLEIIVIKYLASKKNRPALEFIEKIGSAYKTEIQGGFLFTFPVKRLVNLTYDPKSSDENTHVETRNKKEENKKTSKDQKKSSDISDQLQHIADSLNTAEAIYKNVEEFRISASEAESTNFVQPNTDIEKQISSIWQKVLGKTKVGLNDNFFEIGGTSLKAVQLIALIKKELGVNLSIVKLFECPTVGLLSKKLFEIESGNEHTIREDVAERGRRRRENRLARRR